MSQRKALVIPSSGIGDGCIFLSLCCNLAQAGFKVDCIHTNLSCLNDWIDSYQICSREDFGCCSTAIANQYDVIIINKDSSNFTKTLIETLRKSNCSFYLLSPSSRRGFLASENPPIFCRKDLPLLENLSFFYQNIFKITFFEKKTGIQVPLETTENSKSQKYIAIHASASSTARQWPLRRFMKVCKRLQSLGYRPVFIFWDSPQELELAQRIGSQCEKKVFSQIKPLTSFLNSCMYFIGNDSGLGHLASSLKIPTLTIFNCPIKKIFWKPNYTVGVGIAPSRWIPNVKWFRIRTYAFFLIFPWQVMRKFFKLQDLVSK